MYSDLGAKSENEKLEIRNEKLKFRGEKCPKMIIIIDKIPKKKRTR
jgi:hypothetical protein